MAISGVKLLEILNRKQVINNAAMHAHSIFFSNDEGSNFCLFLKGRDFLIELDGDLVNVFGIQALKFLDRPWNKQRSQKASHIQFNFVSFDDLVPYLGRLKQTFPNLIHFEFLETDIRTMSQLNALALLQGLTSLVIGKEGNPIT